MGAQGTTTIDFGAFPGASDASVAVTGQASILGTSLAEAWIFPVATADHTADEHMVESFKVFATDIVAGVGFTIRAFNTSQLNENLEATAPQGKFFAVKAATSAFGVVVPNVGGIGTRIYGQWTVAWVWN